MLELDIGLEKYKSNASTEEGNYLNIYIYIK